MARDCYLLDKEIVVECSDDIGNLLGPVFDDEVNIVG